VEEVLPPVADDLFGDEDGDDVAGALAADGADVFDDNRAGHFMVGESMIFSDASMPYSVQRSRKVAASSRSTETVRASRWSGWKARAYQRTSWVGLWMVGTRTIAIPIGWSPAVCDSLIPDSGRSGDHCAAVGLAEPEPRHGCRQQSLLAMVCARVCAGPGE
jgi:hypothetical protein